MIDADEVLILLLLGSRCRDVVVGEAALSRQRDVLQQRLRLRRETVRRDDVAGKRLLRVGVANHRRQRGKIAAAHGFRRGRLRAGGLAIAARAFVADEEERAIAEDRTANRRAELIEVERRRLSHVEEAARIQVIAAMEDESAALRLVLARLDDHVDLGAGEHAVGRAVLAGLHRHFLQRFQ